jgi:hypothetical protein
MATSMLQTHFSIRIASTPFPSYLLRNEYPRTLGAAIYCAS